ncbi:PAS domain S-box protein [bacterium]|nr:PAS domain S-box protein [bacterium]
MTMTDDQNFFSENLQEDLENLERYIEEYSLFLPLTVFSVNPVGIIVDINQAGKKLSGYQEIELIGSDIETIFKDSKKIKNFFNQIIKKGEEQKKEMILITKNKKEIPVRISASIRKDQENNTIGCFIALNDITEVKKFQEKLENKVKQRTKELEKTKNKLSKTLAETKEAKRKVEDEKNKTSAIISNLVDPIIIIDEHDRLSLFNPKAKEIFKFNNSHIGIKIKKDDHYSMENFSMIIKKELEVIKGKNMEPKNPKEEELIIDHLGEELTYKIITTKVYDYKDKYIGSMKTFSNLTREKRINRLKTEFVSIAAHQLRTPLSAIKWATKMILDGDTGLINQDQREILTKAFESNERMIKLVNDMLNVSRIEEGRLEYTFEKIDFKTVYETVVGNIDGKIKEKSIKFNIEKPKEMPSVYMDKEKIRLVMQNLLENAVKYTPMNGSITLSIKKQRDNLKITVKDNGVGIPKEGQKKLFTKFFRAENVLKMQTDGTGLGLFIANNIIKKHNGKINFKSEEGRGTEFYFYLPINNKQEEK